MLGFGMALRAHNPFLGYTGDMDEAAASCFRTAFVFAGLSAASFGTFVIGAMRAKGGPTPPAREDYAAV